MVMVWFAISGFDGLVTDDAYRKGRDYNETLATAKLRQAQGWHSSIEHIVLPNGKVRLTGVLSVSDPSVSFAEPILEIRRPARADLDQKIKPVPAAPAPNGFLAEVDLPLDGRWLIRIIASDGANELYRQDYEIFVKRDK